MRCGHAREKCGLYTYAFGCLPILLLLPILAFAQTRNPAARKRTVRSVNDIFLLSHAEAASAYPIELQAVVTYSDPEWGLLFVQDQTGATYLGAQGPGIKYPVGARVGVSGVSGATDSGTFVAQMKIVVEGAGVLPKPEQRSIAEINAGVGLSHRVVTEGVLHSCDDYWSRTCFRIYDGNKLLWLLVPQPDSPAAQSLIGATVRATGIAAGRPNGAKIRAEGQLFVNSLKDIKVEVPPLPDSSLPTPIQDVRASEADLRFARQIHVRGKVTWKSPGLFSIQDTSGMLFVGTAKKIEVTTGSTVDAIGFPSQGALGLQLSDSDVRLAEVQSNVGAIAAPLQLSAADVVKRSLNGIRVHLKARLITQSATPTQFLYQLQDGDQRFHAVLLRNDSTHETVGLAHDSILELTGVAVIRSGTEQWPDSLLILIESPADMVVLREPIWLTFRQRLTIAGGLALCVIATLVWVTTLRRTARKQTAVIRARLESEARLETKFRRLFERNLAAVYTWRPDGTLVDCNIAFVKMLGFRTREELIGRSYWEFQVDPHHREQLSGVLHQEALSNRETCLRRDDGVTLYLLKNITPVETAEGTVYETTAIDVTQLRLHQAELQRAKDAAVHEALNDPLTGLPNRRLLMDKLSTLLVEAKRSDSAIALLYLDLDGFKLVNDSLGHGIGDALLTQVGARLRSCVREADLLARLGGDEFMVVLQTVHARQDAALLAEDLREAISTPFEVKGHVLAIGVSIGISLFPEHATDPEELMQRADSAMYVAKREGRNRVMCFTPEIGSQVHERLTLENLLRGAVARNEISVHYQPEFDLNDHHLTRFEALARWTHPTIGQIPPAKFIPIAEESGLIGALGAYIMEQACTEALRWQQIMPYPIQVAVNASNFQFRRNGFVEEVSSILQRTGLSPELLQIEITESAMLAGVQETAETIRRLRAMGISMAIDDFGTGYSNLSYLPSLAFDVLKIDRSFVANLSTQPETESMIRTLIALAHNFGMRVIVEGVETTEQLALVTVLGANEVQGYFTGRPTPNPEIHMLQPAAL